MNDRFSTHRSGGTLVKGGREPSPRAAGERDWLTFASRVLSAIPIVLTVLPLWRTGRGWVRIWDFPRTQLVGLASVALALLHRFGTAEDRNLKRLLQASLAYQAVKIWPYTTLHEYQVAPVKDHQPDRNIRLLMANVLQSNRNSDLMMTAVTHADADVVCLVETDNVRVPQGAKLRLRSGEEIVLNAVHPRPPRPGNSTYGRDAELVMTGREMADDDMASVIIGDLNDMAWSNITTLFQRISHTLDARVGRGMFNTFHARHSLARYPLDHVFHTGEFFLVDMQTLGYTGSDHFPILAELSYRPKRTEDHGRPETTEADRDAAASIMASGRVRFGRNCTFGPLTS